jgi:hypothetical protein
MTMLADRQPVQSGATTEPEPPPALPDVDDAQQVYLAGTYQPIMNVRVVSAHHLSTGPVYFESASGGLAQVLHMVAAELSRLKNLQAGWDGHRARPITREAVFATAAILARVLDGHSEVPQFFPLPGGGIQVIWYTDQVEIEIEIDSAGKAQVVAETAQGETVAEGIFGTQGPPELTETVAGLVRDLSAYVTAERRHRT